MLTISYPHILTTLLIAATICASAQAQAPYKWRDAQGRIVYSDVPPPPSIPESNILKGGKKSAVSAPAVNAAPVPSAAGETKPEETAKPEQKKAAPKTQAELDLEFKKRQQDKAEQEKKEQDKAEQETKRQQYCERAKGYLRALEDGARISETTATGERKFFDDAQRAREIQETKKQMSENKCN